MKYNQRMCKYAVIRRNRDGSFYARWFIQEEALEWVVRRLQNMRVPYKIVNMEVL
jgi:hypothetical protein